MAEIPKIVLETNSTQVDESKTPANQRQNGKTTTEVGSDVRPQPEKTVTEDRGIVKAQFYPEIEPKMRSTTMSDVQAQDERFGHRDEDDQRDEVGIRVSVTSQPPTQGLFSTAVDEDVISAAKERQRRALAGVRLEDEEAPVFVTGKEVVTVRAKEHYQAGMELVNKEDHLSAIVKFNKAVNLRPDIIDFYVRRGECYLQICDFQSAILNFKKACCLEPGNSELYRHLAFSYFLQGQCMFDEKLYEQALDAFTKASEMCPEETGYQTRIISCLGALQRHGECLNMINKRLAVDSDNADLYVMRARLHELFRNRLEIYDTAVEHSVNSVQERPCLWPNVTLCAYDIRDALALEPSHTEALKLQRKLRQKSMENRKVAVQLSALGKTKEALQKISSAIEMDPSNADHHVLRGALHRRLCDFNASIDDYLLALDKTHHSEASQTYQDAQRQLLLTYNDFAVECFTKGFYEEAIILLNKALKGEKSEKGLYVNRGDCFFKQGELNFAQSDYEQAMELDPDDPTISTRLSVVEHEFGVLDYQDKRYQEAEKRFSAAISQNPRVGRYYLSRSRAKYMLEDQDSAKFDILTALILDPENEELISITSRLFPGQSVREVLASPQADDARRLMQQQRQNSIGRTTKLSTRGRKSSDGKTPDPLPSVRVRKASPLWKREPVQPDLTLCMNEWQFNLTIIEEKKTINTSIKKALKERKSLKYTGGRVSSMPSRDELRRHTKSLVKVMDN